VKEEWVNRVLDKEVKHRSADSGALFKVKQKDVWLPSKFHEASKVAPGFL
jgi:hypothetical protein